jgi:hypothetical protein
MDDDAIFSLVQDQTSVTALIQGIDNRKDPISLCPSYKSMGRFTVGGIVGTLTIDNGVSFRKSLHDFLPVRITT